MLAATPKARFNNDFETIYQRKLPGSPERRANAPVSLPSLTSHWERSGYNNTAPADGLPKPPPGPAPPPQARLARSQRRGARLGKREPNIRFPSHPNGKWSQRGGNGAARSRREAFRTDPVGTG